MSMLDEETVEQLLSDLPPELLMSVVATFEQDAGGMLDAMQAAAQRGDGPGWARAAHSLTGSAGAVGARALMDTARRCSAGVQPDPLLLPMLRAQLRASCGALRDRIAVAR